MYAALNIHSHYSIGWGVVSPEKLCDAARSYGCHSLAMTDTNNLCGLHFFLDFAKACKIRPIVGAELSIANQRLTLLVRTRQGYSNLCRLISEIKLDSSFRINKIPSNDFEGLVVLSDSCQFIEAQHNKIEHLYAEIVCGMPVVKLLRLARKLGVKPIASTRSFWVQDDDQTLHRLNRAISLNCTMHTLPEDSCAAPKSRFLSEGEMRDEFGFCPEAVDNTIEVADLCTWKPDFGIVYPEIETGLNGKSYNRLRKMSYEGARWRYGKITSAVTERLEHELMLIKHKGFSPVFLVVEDIVKQSPRTCGRGSAAASIVSYCLGITHVDPLKHNLFFERFISEVRQDAPDIDVDFAWDERDDILDYVFNKYGVDHAAMVSNHVTFQKRAAVREVAKVMGIPANEISTITKKLTHGFSYTGKSITEHPSLSEHDFPSPWREILDYASRLEGIPRHMSVHCGGVVITPRPTVNWVPTELAAKGVRIIQWEKDQTEDSGLVKIDLLGNRSLAVIRDSLMAIEANHNVKLEYATWNPIDDELTQGLIARGDTVGVFYVESPAARLLQQKAGVGDYEHLVLHSSMIRPAANKFINLYLNRLHGEPFEPLHPLMGNLLDENYGIMVYQEDVTRVAMKLASFPLLEADELRKIISKKHKHRRLKDLKELFFRGAAEKRVDRDAIDRIWEMVMSFAGYSFCKAHSASYALVSFKSAFLRAHYPAEFMAAVISNGGGFYHAFAYVSEAKRMGIEVLPIDINLSEFKYIGSTNTDTNHQNSKSWMRVGLMQVKGLSKLTMERLIDVRKTASYLSLEDCFKRASLNLAEARLLVKAGCFDSLETGRSRPELLWNNILLDSEDSDITQHDLFHTPLRQHPKPPQYNQRKLLDQEIDTLGFLISQHPLDIFRNMLKNRPVIQGKNLHHHIGRSVEIAGWLVTGKVVPTKNRESMEFVTFEDTTALVETVLFPIVYAKFSHIISYSRPFRIRGLVEESFGAITMTVETIGYL